MVMTMAVSYNFKLQLVISGTPWESNIGSVSKKDTYTAVPFLGPVGVHN